MQAKDTFAYFAIEVVVETIIGVVGAIVGFIAELF